MTRYVLSFAQQIPLAISQNILLVQKIKPAWQEGRLNLPGGHVEPGETIEQAACRELFEETSIESDPWNASILGTMAGNDWEVAIVKCLYHAWKNGAYQWPKKLTDEEVMCIDYRNALQDPRLIANLKVIIPLCMTGVTGWRMVAASDPAIGDRWVLCL